MALITETQLRVRSVRGIPNPFPVAEGDMLTPAAADFLKERGIAIVRGRAAAQADLPASGDDVGEPSQGVEIPVGVSNRHIHLSPGHVEALFGAGYNLTPLRELSQKGQFAARETITLVGPKGMIAGVRVLGPARGATQVEISRTDGYTLGIQPPVRLSGNTAGTPGITLSGAQGMVVLKEGLIVARNHVHMSPDDAARFKVAHGDRMILRSNGDRPVVFADVTVRVSPHYSLDFHIDTDEANASDLRTGDVVEVIGVTGRHAGK